MDMCICIVGKFGGLVICLYNRQIKIHQSSYASIIIQMAILHWTANFPAMCIQYFPVSITTSYCVHHIVYVC